MKAMLSYKEKKYAQKLIKSSNSLEASIWPEWGSWIVFALGGFMIVSVCFITLENPHAISIKYVLLPGVTIGMGLMLFGAYMQHIALKAEEQQVLTGLVKKLKE